MLNTALEPYKGLAQAIQPVLSPRAAKSLAEAEQTKWAMGLAERAITHPLFSVIIGVTLIEQLRKANVISEPIAGALNGAALTPAYLKALADAAGTGMDIARLIAMFRGA